MQEADRAKAAPAAALPGCEPGGGAGLFQLLVVLLETSSGQRWVAGWGRGDAGLPGALQRNFQGAGGALGLYWLTRGPECEIARDPDPLRRAGGTPGDAVWSRRPCLRAARL